MTSWFRQTAKPLPKKDSLLFETDEAELCSQFNRYLYATLYARSINTRLYVNDTPNAVSIRYPLIQNTFVALTDLSGVKFVDTPLLTATSIGHRVIPMRVFLNTVPVQKLRTEARALFAWNPSLLDKINPLTAKLDVGVHMLKSIAVDQYIREVERYQLSTKKERLNVFVMSDSPEAIQEFSAKAKGWTVLSIRPPFSTSSSPQRQRMDSYLHRCGELYTIQNAAHIISAFSSQVGRFLYLTTDSVVSMDDKVFTAA